MEYINLTKISEKIYSNLDKIFSINFTLLAFIITAITILLMLQKGEIVRFKKADLLEDVINIFKKALDFNFISGIVAVFGYFVTIQLTYYKYCISLLVTILFTLSLIYIYKAYKFLLFFIKYQ